MHSSKQRENIARHIRDLDMNASIPSPEDLARQKKLDLFFEQIPTETSLLERRLLYSLFRDQWDGSGSVIEIGPFLGGTTRAIAWGMMFNPKRQKEATLETFDRFGEYRSEENLREFVQPLFDGGLLGSKEADQFCDGGSFEALFRAIHSPFEYWELIRLHNAALPDLPDEIDQSTAFDPLVEKQIGAVFVDGCKSWAATYYAMIRLLPRMKPGSLVIFQDFGWHTCFWISSFVHALREFLQVESHADGTYVFHLRATPKEKDIADRFARSPAEMSLSFFSNAAAELTAASRQNGDLRGELIAQLHHIAALATVGEKSSALELLKALDVDRYTPFLPLIEMCVESPTYLPNGETVSWKD